MTPGLRQRLARSLDSRLITRPLTVVLTILVFWRPALKASLSAQQSGDQAQGSRETEKGLIYQRRVQLPQGSALPGIIMTEFFTDGALAAGGANLAVYDNRNSPVPWRILQAGPGDLCRIAFQTVPKQHLYKIHYGGKGEPQQATPLDKPSRPLARDPPLAELRSQFAGLPS